MNNFNTSKGAVERAFRWYQGAIRACEDERWDDVIFSLQMSVEQALKAILILFGIEYPKKHDVSTIYVELKQKQIPEWFKEKIDNQVDMLKNLVKLGGKAAYGYVDGLKKDDFKDDPSNFKDPVKDVIEDCNNLVIEFSKKKIQKNDDNGSDK
jgi:HEPN domain-containing protein